MPTRPGSTFRRASSFRTTSTVTRTRSSRRAARWPRWLALSVAAKGRSGRTDGSRSPRGPSERPPRFLLCSRLRPPCRRPEEWAGSLQAERVGRSAMREDRRPGPGPSSDRSAPRRRNEGGSVRWRTCEGRRRCDRTDRPATPVGRWRSLGPRKACPGWAAGAAVAARSARPVRDRRGRAPTRERRGPNSGRRSTPVAQLRLLEGAETLGVFDAGQLLQENLLPVIRPDRSEARFVTWGNDWCDDGVDGRQEE